MSDDRVAGHVGEFCAYLASRGAEDDVRALLSESPTENPVHKDGLVGVYFRVEPGFDHFIVSDLGEAITALRISSGDHEPQLPFVSGVRRRRDALCPWRIVTPSELPRAILSVMAAAYRVTNYDPRSEISASPVAESEKTSG